MASFTLKNGQIYKYSEEKRKKEVGSSGKNTSEITQQDLSAAAAPSAVDLLWQRGEKRRDDMSGWEGVAFNRDWSLEDANRYLGKKEQGIAQRQEDMDRIARQYGATPDAEGRYSFQSQQGYDAFKGAARQYDSAVEDYLKTSQDAQDWYGSRQYELRRQNAEIEAQLAELEKQYAELVNSPDVTDPTVHGLDQRGAELQERIKALQGQRWYNKAETSVLALSQEEQNLLDIYNGDTIRKSDYTFTDAFGGETTSAEYQARQRTARKEALQHLKDRGYTEDEIKVLAEQKAALRDREKAMANYEADAESVKGSAANAALGTVASVVLSPVKGAGLIEGARSVLPEWAGGYHDKERPTNIYSPLFNASRYSQAVRGQVGQDLSDRFDQAKMPELLGGGNWAQFLYNAGTSALDSAWNMALASGIVNLGAGAMGKELTQKAANKAIGRTMNWIMGSEAAADATMEGVQKGYSNEKALAMGIVSGLIEGITEEYSVEYILDKIISEKSLVGLLGKSFLAEGGEEVAGNWLNRLSDFAFNGDANELRAAYRRHLAERKAGTQAVNASAEEAALADTVMDLIGEDAASFLAGGLSGFAMAGTGAALGTASQFHTENTGAKLLDKATQSVLRGGSVSNRTATAILNNPAAVSALEQTTGMTISEGMSKAEQRSAVKEAVAGSVRPADSSAAPWTGNNTPGRNAAYTVGREGQSVIESMRLEGQDEADYRAAMTGYYRSGLENSGKAFSGTKIVAPLTEGQAKAAYIAGQADALKASQAKYFAKDAGFDRTTDAVWKQARLSSKTVRSLDAIGKALGVKIRMVESVNQGQANAQYKNGVIELALDAEDPVMVSAVHEAVHRIREAAPQAYLDLSAFVLENLSNQQMDFNLRSRQSQYGNSIDTLTEETVADAFGRMLQDSRMFEQFAKDNRTVAERLLDTVRDILNAVRRALNRQNVQLTTEQREAFSDLEDQMAGMEKLMADALKATASAARTQSDAATRNGDGAVKYSLKEYSQHQIDNWANSKNIIVYQSEKQLQNFLKEAVENKLISKMYFGTVSDDLAARILQETGFDFSGRNVTLRADNVRKIIKDHGNENKEAARGQRPVTLNDFSHIPEIIGSPDSISPGEYRGHPAAVFAKEINDSRISVFAVDSGGSLDLFIQTMYAGHKKGSIANVTDVNTPIITSETSVGTAPGNNISRSDAESKPKSSLKSQEQLARFTEEYAAEKQTSAALRNENAMLRERVAHWRNETRRTKVPTMDAKAVRATARELVKAYGAAVDVNEVAGELQGLYDMIAADNQGGDEMAFANELWGRANEISRKLVENATVENETVAQYHDLKSFLRTTRINLSATDAADISDYNDFRKRNFGRLRLGGGNTNIDQVYSELAERWPEWFDEQEQLHPADQLARIVEVLDKLADVTENPFSSYLEQAVQGTANEIMERYFDLPKTKPTFADKQAAKLEALRKQNQARIREVMQREAKRREDAIEGLKDQYRSREAEGRERRSARELRQKITRHANALSRKLLTPSDRQHIPEELRGAVSAVLDAINQESAYVQNLFGQNVKDKGLGGLPTKRTAAFQALREQYGKVLSEGLDMVIDPDLLGDAASGFPGLFEQVISMRDVRLADMSTAQLSTVWRTLKAVEHSVSTAGKILSQTKFKGTVEWAAALTSSTSTRSARNTLAKNGLLIDIEMPYTFFSHYGEAGAAIYRMLRDAQDRQQIMVDQVAAEVAQILDPKTAARLREETHTFTTAGGDALTLTTDQIMDLYNLWNRPQARDHILVGGIVQPEVRAGKTKIRRGTDSIRLTLEDVAGILSTLTPEQEDIAQRHQQLCVGLLAGLGNEASMKVYGYKKFTEKNYWMIRTAKEGVHASVEKGAGQARSIRNIGMAKNTTPHANNPLDLRGLQDSFAGHVSDMVDYAAWLAPMEDAERLYNFRFKDGEGNWTGKTVKGMLDLYGGAGSQKYWRNLMEDIQNGIKTPGDSTLSDWAAKATGNVKGAAVGANIRVVAQQPTAWIRAALVLDPVDMAKGLVSGVTKGNGWEKATKYSPIAMRKAAGGFDISSPVKMNQILYDEGSALQKFNDAMGWGAEQADAITWGRIWNACEWAVSRGQIDLKPDSKAFYEAVNRLFTETIDQTQVVDGVMQRSQVMRSANAVTQQASSFMGEPIMSANMVLRAYDGLRYEQDAAKRGQAIKHLSRAVGAFTVNAAVNALVQSLIDGFRDDDKDKKYWERVIAAFVGLEGNEDSLAATVPHVLLGANLTDNLNPLGAVPYVSDLLSILQGFSVERLDMSSWSDLINASKILVKSLGGEGNKTVPYAFKQFSTAATKVMGISAANILRDVWAIARSAVSESGNYRAMYQMERAVYTLTKSNSGRFYDILYRALESGDLETYKDLRTDMMLNAGVSGKDVDSAMRSRLKKKSDADGAYTIPDAARDLIGVVGKYMVADEAGEDPFNAGMLDAAAYGQYADRRAQSYRAMLDTLNSYKTFAGMDSEAKNRILKAAASLAESQALEAAAGGQYSMDTGWMRWATGGADYGVDETEAILFKIAYDMTEGTQDPKTDKVIPGSKKENTLKTVKEQMPWLTDRELQYLESNYWTPANDRLKNLKDHGYK